MLSSFSCLKPALRVLFENIGVCLGVYVSKCPCICGCVHPYVYVCVVARPVVYMVCACVCVYLDDSRLTDFL